MTQNIDYHDDEIDLKDLLKVLWIQKKIIIFILIGIEKNYVDTFEQFFLFPKCFIFHQIHDHSSLLICWYIA